jgi:hypothetical protein
VPPRETEFTGDFLAWERSPHACSVRMGLQKPAVAGGHGVLAMGDVTDPDKVARHDREGCYARNR